MPYRLLKAFEGTFHGSRYIHRNSTLGDRVAVELYEDLLRLGKSSKYSERVESHEWVVGASNTRQGIVARRGDGTFGERVPGTEHVLDAGFDVARGTVATVEVGVEVKILAKEMIKQIDRVVGDLIKQVGQFQRGGSRPVSIAIVGINHAPYAVSYEGDRLYRTDGTKHRHPAQEADDAAMRILNSVASVYDELVLLRYTATNDEPYEFAWVNRELTERDYGAALVRIIRQYDARF